jgi:phenylpyruvate tautomerase PptA (4-oxalocrotonate tautomerase family)
MGPLPFRGRDMPNILIETRAGWVTDPAAVIDAVHSAVQRVLKLPDWDRTVRLVEHAPSHFPLPPGKGERYTLIDVAMFSGRSMTAKRALYEAIVGNLEALGVPPDDTKICLIEIAPENWGVRGGRPASEVDPGFEIKV